MMPSIAALLDQALNSANTSGAQMNALADSLTAPIDSITQNSAVAVQNIQAAGEQAAEAARATAQSNYAQRQAVQYAQGVLNLNPDDANNALAVSTAQLNSAQDRHNAARAKQAQLTAISPMDDLLGYIVGQLELPQVTAQVESAAGDIDAANKNINNRLQTLQAYKGAVVANTADNLLKAENAAAAQVLAEATGRAAETQMRALTATAGLRAQQATFRDKINDNFRQVMNMYVGALGADAQRGLVDAQRAQLTEMRQMRLDAMKKDVAAEGEINERLKTIGEYFGVPGLTVPLLNKVVPNPKDRQAVMVAAVNGLMGVDLAESTALFNALPVKGELAPGINKFWKETLAQGRQYRDQVEAANLKGAAQGKEQKLKPAQLDEEGMREMQRSWMTSAMSSAPQGNKLSDPRFDNQFSPYVANHRMMLDEIQAGGTPLSTLQENPLVKALSAVATQSRGERDITRNEEAAAIKSLAMRVATRELAPEAAASAIREYYGAAVQKNKDLYQYTYAGLPPQTGYQVVVPAGNFFGDPVRGDLLSKAATERMIKELAIQVAPPLNTGMPSRAGGPFTLPGTK